MAVPTPPTIIDAQIKNLAYGYPQGQRRKHDPAVLMVIHITGNRSTAAVNGTRGEVAFMGRPIVAGGHYNSAHNYIDRNGLVYWTVPLVFPAWNNGDLLKPDTGNKGVAALVAGARAGINPNELCWREVECTGYPGSFPVTDAQIGAVAYLIAKDSIKTGLPINRNTVLTHADINSVNRANCAFPPGQREAEMAKLINLAHLWKQQIKDDGSDPATTPPPPPPDLCQDAKDQLAAAQGQVDDLQAQLAGLIANVQADLNEVASPAGGQP